MAYQQYQKQKGRQVFYPAVNVGKKGYFSLNAMCVEKYAKDCTHVELFYDDVSKKIGLKPIKTVTTHAIPLNIKPGSHYATISAASFFKYFNLSAITQDIYPVEWNKVEKMIELDVSKALESPSPELKERKSSPNPTEHSRDMEL